MPWLLRGLVAKPLQGGMQERPRPGLRSPRGWEAEDLGLGDRWVALPLGVDWPSFHSGSSKWLYLGRQHLHHTPALW